MSTFKVGDRVRLRGMKRAATVTGTYQFPDPSRQEMVNLDRELSRARTSSRTWAAADLITAVRHV